MEFKGVSVESLTAKCAKTANKKGSVPCRLFRLEAFPVKKGVSLIEWERLWGEAIRGLSESCRAGGREGDLPDLRGRGRGEGGIRTPGPRKDNGFQDRRYRPLSHLSEGEHYTTGFSS